MLHGLACHSLSRPLLPSFSSFVAEAIADSLFDLLCRDIVQRLFLWHCSYFRKEVKDNLWCDTTCGRGRYYLGCLRLQEGQSVDLQVRLGGVAVE